MSVLEWNENEKMWWNTQNKEWWKICKVCKEAKHKAIYPRCMNCTVKGKR